MEIISGYFIHSNGCFKYIKDGEDKLINLKWVPPYIKCGKKNKCKLSVKGDRIVEYITLKGDNMGCKESLYLNKRSITKKDKLNWKKKTNLKNYPGCWQFLSFPPSLDHVCNFKLSVYYIKLEELLKVEKRFIKKYVWLSNTGYCFPKIYYNKTLKTLNHVLSIKSLKFSNILKLEGDVLYCNPFFLPSLKSKDNLEKIAFDMYWSFLWKSFPIVSYNVKKCIQAPSNCTVIKNQFEFYNKSFKNCVLYFNTNKISKLVLMQATLNECELYVNLNTVISDVIPVLTTVGVFFKEENFKLRQPNFIENCEN